MKNFVIILVLAGMVVAGCRGNKEEKLIGEWKKIPFIDPDSVDYIEYWVFYNGDALVVRRDSTVDTTPDSIQYTYDLDGKKLRVFGDWPYLPAAGDFRGEYWIDQLNDDYLKMTKRKHPDDTASWGGSKEGAFLRIELVKQ